jgi:hypothetical protein
MLTTPDSRLCDEYIFKHCSKCPNGQDMRLQLPNKAIKDKIEAAMDKIWVFLDLAIRCAVPVAVIKSLGQQPTGKHLFSDMVIDKITDDLIAKGVLVYDSPTSARDAVNRWARVSGYPRIQHFISIIRKELCEGLVEMLKTLPIMFFEGQLHGGYLVRSVYAMSCSKSDGTATGSRDFLNTNSDT